MAQIEYCDDEVRERSWHPIFEGDLCADSSEDEWGLIFADLEWQVSQSQSEAADNCAVENPKEVEFQLLASRWKRETSIYGHLSKIVMHRDYQRIMAMGPDVIPLILEDLAKQSAHWFWALHNLVPPGQDPAEGLTTMAAARQAWLEWGRNNNLL
jgi:hypothetical protein